MDISVWENLRNALVDAALRVSLEQKYVGMSSLENGSDMGATTRYLLFGYTSVFAPPKGDI